MAVSCGSVVISVLTGGLPVALVDNVLRSTGADPVSTTADDLSRALRCFDLRLAFYDRWKRGAGPLVTAWLRRRPGALMGERLVLLVDQNGREGRHWIAACGSVLADSYTGGRWLLADVDGHPGLPMWRMRQAWKVTPG